MGVYVCRICGYEYDEYNGDEEHGIDKGTDFEDLPVDWECPLCGALREDFEKTYDADEESGDL